MANQLFKEMTKTNNPSNPHNGDMRSEFNSFLQNPMQFMMKKRINIPEQYANDPEKAVRYLVNNGQMPQQVFNELRNAVSKMGFKV